LERPKKLSKSLHFEEKQIEWYCSNKMNDLCEREMVFELLDNVDNRLLSQLNNVVPEVFVQFSALFFH
jgi:hypothetical protein